MEWHHNIRSQLCSKSKNAMNVQVTGGEWGLACNSIHFIDLVSWWTGSEVDYVNGDSLRHWKPSKRSGFQEVLGGLKVIYRDGSLLEILCDQSNANLNIKGDTPEGCWLIDELSGKTFGPSGQKILGRLDYQSSLTAPLVMQILATGQCRLPSLKESAAQHRPYLDTLLSHWNHSQGLNDLVAPIT